MVNFMISDNTKVSLTTAKIISILVFVISLSFTIGMTYQGLIPDRDAAKKQSEEIQDIKITLAKVSTILENMKEKHDITSRNISAIQDRTNMLNSEIQVLSSYIKEDARKSSEKSNR